jgi:DNA-binding transcriptional MerR regulator
VAKGPEAFRTISEAADELSVPQHVLRFWETKFTFIRPMKRAGGRRFYRPADIAVLRGVRRLLHDEGYTIKGVQRLHREQGLKRLVAAGEGAPAGAPAAPAAPPAALPAGTSVEAVGRDRLAAILQDLEAARRRLDEVLKG